MVEQKLECLKCGALILQSTADQNNGRCKPCSAGPNLENIAEGTELGLRLFLGVIGGVSFAGLGYAIGSFAGSIAGIVCAIPFAMIGFVYGCFRVEINLLIRTMLPMIFDI